MSRWKIKRDIGKEARKLQTDATRAANYASSEKKWSKNMGMMAALAVPMIVTTVFSGGTALPLWAGMLSAGVGAAAGAKLGEEIAEAKEKGGIQFGEDKYSKGKGIREGKFNKGDREAVKNSMIQNAKDLDSGMLKDAAVASVMYGVKVGGKDLMKSGKGMIKGTLTGDEALKSASKSAFKDKMFGTTAEKAAFKEAVQGQKDKFAAKVAGLKDGTIAKPDIDLQASVSGGAKNKVLRNLAKNNVSPEQRLKGRGAMKEWWDKVKPRATYKGKVIGEGDSASLLNATGGGEELITDAVSGNAEEIYAINSPQMLDEVVVEGVNKSENLADVVMDKTKNVASSTTPPSSSPLRSAIGDGDLLSSVSKVKQTNMASAFSGSAQDYVNANVNFELEDKLYDMFVGGGSKNKMMSRGMWDMVGNMFEPKEEKEETQGVV